MKSLLLYIGLICSLIHFMSWVCLFVHSCREFKNLNSFFAIIMGMSNPAVSRLSQTWEVNFLWSASRSLLNLKCFPLLPSTTVKSSVFSWQKLPTKFKKFYAEFESMMVSYLKFHLPPLSRGGSLIVSFVTAEKQRNNSVFFHET